MYWITGILGLALAISPFVLGFSGDMVALWTSLIIGGVTLIVSLIEGARADREKWEYWTAAILGLIAIAAPFVFGFSSQATATWTSVVVGILIAILAGSKLSMGQIGKM